MIQKISDIFEDLMQKGVPAEKATIEHVNYCLEMEAGLSGLEHLLHFSDDNGEILMAAMAAACKFYQGNWAGFLQIDEEMGIWSPYAWYNPCKIDLTEQLVAECENMEFLPRWIESICTGDPIILPDVESIKLTHPKEYDLLRRVRASSVLAVPIKPRPMGFVVVRNPQRYIHDCSMLRLLGYVMLAQVNEQKLLRSLKLAPTPEHIENESDVIINLLGSIEIVTSVGTLHEADLKSPKICRLLGYMLTHMKALYTTTELVDAIWPERVSDAEIDSNTLRALIFRLKQSFALISKAPLIERTSNGYRFNPKLRIITDLTMFDKLWDAAHKSASVGNRTELLKEAFGLYRGTVLGANGIDSWITATITYYQTRYEGICRELFRLLDWKQDYYNIQKYASIAVKVVPGFPKAHFWLIKSMRILGAIEMAESQLEIARQKLTEEDYEDLVNEIRSIPAANLQTGFHPDNLPS